MSALEPTPFRIEVPDDDIEDLRDRLARTRWAEDFANDDWSYGMQGEYLRELVAYWLDGYDWRRHEAAMNEFPQFRVEIDDVPIHFLHVRGRGRRVVPLVLTHGWPWTFWDFQHVIRPLADPAGAGASDELAFDVVVPSLPGYGFSSPLRRTGVNPQVTADLWARLMTDVLGYERFGAHGGDWGSVVTANLAHAYADRLVGAHLSLPALLGVNVMNLATPDQYGPDEQGWFERWTSRMATARAHVAVHRDAPQTIGWALNDSPVGLAAWIVERRRLWSDCDGDVESVFSKDDLLTTVCLYWFTQTFTTSARFYAESMRRGPGRWEPRHDRQPPMEAPTGMAVFPYDLLLLPRAVVEQHANLVHWSVMPRGGHFAAAEQPELLTADLRAFFGTL